MITSELCTILLNKSINFKKHENELWGYKDTYEGLSNGEPHPGLRVTLHAHIHTPKNIRVCGVHTHARMHTCAQKGAGTHKHAHAHARTRAHTHLYTHKHMRAHTRKHTDAEAHAHEHARAHAHSHAGKYTQAEMRLHTQTLVRKHTHTHTHACTRVHAHLCLHIRAYIDTWKCHAFWPSFWHISWLYFVFTYSYLQNHYKSLEGHGT